MVEKREIDIGFFIFCSCAKILKMLDLEFALISFFLSFFLSFILPPNPSFSPLVMFVQKKIKALCLASIRTKNPVNIYLGMYNFLDSSMGMLTP